MASVGAVASVPTPPPQPKSQQKRSPTPPAAAPAAAAAAAAPSPRRRTACRACCVGCCRLLLLIVIAVTAFTIHYIRTNRPYEIADQVTHNWDLAFQFRPKEYVTPRTEDDIVDCVRRAALTKQKIKVVGGGHSWSDIAEPVDIQMSLMPHYNRIISLDRDKKQVTVQAGVRIRDLINWLARERLAMTNLGSINVQAIAGAMLTGTHGTGITKGNLASTIVELTMVLANASVITVNETHNAHLLPAVKLSLGALGIVSTITMQVEDLFSLHSLEYSLTSEELFAVEPSSGVSRFQHIVQSNEHVKYWWFPHTNFTHVYEFNRTPRPHYEPEPLWILNALTYPMEALTALAAYVPALVPVVNQASHNIGFPRKERVARYDHVLNIPHRVPPHAEAEYAVPFDRAESAVRAIMHLIPHHQLFINFIVELRFVRADTLWMSNSYERDTCHITLLITSHVVAMRDRYFALVEELMLREYDARPHWAKTFYADHTRLATRIPRYADFVAVRNTLDPTGMFTNPFLDRVLPPLPHPPPRAASATPTYTASAKKPTTVRDDL